MEDKEQFKELSDLLKKNYSEKTSSEQPRMDEVGQYEQSQSYVATDADLKDYYDMQFSKRKKPSFP